MFAHPLRSTCWIMACLVALVAGCSKSSDEAEKSSNGKAHPIYAAAGPQAESPPRRDAEEWRRRRGPIGEPDLRQTCVNALGMIGPAAVPALIDALKDRDAGIREGAARAIARIGPPAHDALPELLSQLRQEKDSDVRKQIIHAIGQMGELAGGAVPAIVDELRESAQ